MVRITVAGEDLDLPEGFALSIEETSPIFNDIGSQAIAVNLPDTLRNRRILGFPRRPDAVGSQSSTSVGCTVISGVYVRTGLLNTDSAADDGISVSIGFDNSRAYDAWKSKKLSEVESLPCLRFRDMDAVAKEINRLFVSADPRYDDLAVFPICVGEEEVSEKLEGNPKEGEVYREMLNDFVNDYHIFLSNGEKEREVMRVFDGCEAMITVPNGYGCTPLVRVWRILEAVFSDLGLQMVHNPFREDIELARLVVLNNTADAVCAATLDYAELMPDCTVEEFLHSLFVRFGFVYRTDFDSGFVHALLVRDIMARDASLEIDSLLIEDPNTEFRTPQYVKLSAGTSLEGAAPFTERMEDYVLDYSLLGWDGEGIPENEDTSEVADDVNPELEFWPIDRKTKQEEPLYQYYWEGVPGTLWRQDLSGRYGVDSSSSFFVWDPQPEGYEAWELASTDECCPVCFSKIWGASFIVGVRHRHTRTKSAERETDSECPLSFMFALTGLQGSKSTGGRLSAYRDQNLPPEGFYFDYEPIHDISLFFQFRIGHYAKFWKDFDLMLRGADRRINAKVRIGKDQLRALDVLAPVRLWGVPMLIDTADATIGDGSEVTVDMVLLPMMRHAKADMPPFSAELPAFPPDPAVLS